LVNPTFSLVATLIRRGHRVTYVTSERFAVDVAALGAEVLRCPRIDSPFDQDDDAALPIEHQYVRDLASLAARTFALTWPFYAKDRPDLVIYDAAAFAGMLVADKSGTTAIRMSNQFDYTEETLGGGEVPLALQRQLCATQRQADELFTAHASHRRNVILAGKDATFYFYLSDLQLRRSIPAPDAFYAARCTAERPNVARWRRPTRRSRPAALVTSSTTYVQDARYYGSCLLALADLGWETFLSVGTNSTAADFGPLPANCHPVQNIPLVAIMPHVDLLICAAGLATAMEALYHGLPMLMLTAGYPELEAYAAKFHGYGVGVHLDQASAGPANVAHHADRIRNDTELQLAVKRAQNAVKRSAGAEELVNWLEQRGLVASGARPPS
jgi:MGT family glycosyltransferase